METVFCFNFQKAKMLLLQTDLTAVWKALGRSVVDSKNGLHLPDGVRKIFPDSSKDIMIRDQYKVIMRHLIQRSSVDIPQGEIPASSPYFIS